MWNNLSHLEAKQKKGGSWSSFKAGYPHSVPKEEQNSDLLTAHMPHML